MKLLIDIPEKDYLFLNSHLKDKNLWSNVEKIVAKGTPIMSGEWIYEETVLPKYRCSCCNKYVLVSPMGRDDKFEDMNRTDAYKFCPRCGAEMRESEDKR